MIKLIEEILKQEDFSRKDIIQLLKANKKERNLIYKRSAEIKEQYVGKKAYYR